MLEIHIFTERIRLQHGRNMYILSVTHPKARLLHSKFLSALFKQMSEGPHFCLGVTNTYPKKCH